MASMLPTAHAALAAHAGHGLLPNTMAHGGFFDTSALSSQDGRSLPLVVLVSLCRSMYVVLVVFFVVVSFSIRDLPTYSIVLTGT
jgi:hypothetical protein